ncbi:DUF2878 domain-containing protein [Gilvimarinus agarilyticus]|uniref:DUF2878 domain-containing protein n=1 Tax=Gilvimarinus agarilyticus TaxID=679259 RepID=UPI00059F7279|nr:DUF2878 domain-containing protein [Gilvimarinus agarilyticus]
MLKAQRIHLVRLITNMSLFQVGWFVCLIGGSYWALGFTLVALVVHTIFILHSPREWRLLAGIALAGIVWDGLLMSTGLISFAAPQSTVYIGEWFALIPVWLICLWVLFATTVNHSLYWLARYPLASALLAALFAPISYFAGVKISDAQFAIPIWQPLMAVAIGWAIVFPTALCYCRRHCRPNARRLS